MRTNWAYFVGGFFIVALSSFYFSKSMASNEDARVKNMQDPTLSGAKTPVPTVDEIDVALQDQQKGVLKQEQRVKEREERLEVEEVRFKDKIEELQRVQDEIEKIQRQNKDQSDQILAKIE